MTKPRILVVETKQGIRVLADQEIDMLIIQHDQDVLEGLNDDLLRYDEDGDPFFMEEMPVDVQPAHVDECFDDFWKSLRTEKPE